MKKFTFLAFIFSFISLDLVYAQKRHDLNLYLYTTLSEKVERIKKSDLKAIFYGDRKIEGLKSSYKLFIFYHDKNVLDQFFNDYFSRSLSDYESHWRRKLFSGRAFPPKQISQESQLEHYLQSQTSSSVILSTVKLKLERLNLNKIKID